METNRFRNSTGDNQLFDEIWRSLIDTRMNVDQYVYEHDINFVS